MVRSGTGNPRLDWGIPSLGWAVRVGGEWLTLGASFWVACPLVQVILAEFGASGGPGGCVSRLPQLTKDSVAKVGVVGGWKLETTCVR